MARRGRRKRLRSWYKVTFICPGKTRSRYPTCTHLHITYIHTYCIPSYPSGLKHQRKELDCTEERKERSMETDGTGRKRR